MKRPAYFTAKRAPVSTQALTFGRSRWRTLISEGKDCARAFIDGRPVHEFTWSSFKRNLEKTPPSGLPLEKWGVSGPQAYQSFLAAGRGLIVAATPNRIQAFARLLMTAGTLLEDLLDETATLEAAASWGRQFPGEGD